MYAGTLVTSLLFSLFLAIIFSQPILWLQRKKVPKGLSIAAVFLLILVIIGIYGEVISSSFSSFSENLPKYEQNISEMSAGAIQFLEEKGIQVSTENLSSVFNPAKAMGVMTGFISDFGGIMGNSFTIFFLTLFLLLEMDTIPVKVKAIIKGELEALDFLDTIGDSIRHYLSIKTVTSLLTGVLIWVALSIVGVDYAIIWAIIAFLLNYIPNIGSIIAAVPAMLFALVQLGVVGVVWTTIIFIVANMVIGNVVEPKMMGKGLGLSTFVVFLSLIFWGFMLGTIGMFLSVPLTMAFKIAFEQNPKTKWAAIALGTEDDARRLGGDIKTATD
jgi:predicted PurR-regulated permease PerM